MELEDFKNTWIVLDERLKKTEFMQGTIITEMVRTKVDKTTSKLLNLEILGTGIMLLLIPFIIYSISKCGGHFSMWDMLMFFSLMVVIVDFFWILNKIHSLMKVDFSKNIAENIYHVNKYEIKVRQEKIAMYLVWPVLVLLVILTYVQKNASITLWVFMVCMLIFAILYSYWAYRKVYDKHIASILKSFEELKELKDE